MEVQFDIIVLLNYIGYIHYMTNNMTNKFKIESIRVYNNWNEVKVTVKIDVKVWNYYKKDGLGMLYGTDISNAVYEIDKRIPASHPIVNDRERSRRGVKTITLTYSLNETEVKLFDFTNSEYMLELYPNNEERQYNNETAQNVINVDFVNKKRIA